MSDPTSIADLRRDYKLAELRRADLDPDPIAQFSKWFEQARASQVVEPNAMALATVGPDGKPSARIVLLKQLDARGFIFYTNYLSRKGRELAQNPAAALDFFWPELERQVCVAGTVSKISREEAAKYFASRPKLSRLAAWASSQSEAVPNREFLEKRMQEITAQYPGEDVPLPPHWGGFCLAPERIEFWQGRRSRLHDRFQYSLGPEKKWTLERLLP
jgi:pyridoxamine 5'-phosphate oxidase